MTSLMDWYASIAASHFICAMLSSCSASDTFVTGMPGVVRYLASLAFLASTSFFRLPHEFRALLRSVTTCLRLEV